jgi:hypothetical protein
MTTIQKNSISSPATGLVVFDTTLNRYEVYNGSSWSAFYVDPSGWNTIVKSANQDVVNSVTYSTDTDLQFSVLSGGHYMIELDLIVSADNQTGDWRGRLAVSSGTMKGSGICTHINATSAAATTYLVAANSSTVTQFIVGTNLADIDLLASAKIIYSFYASANATFYLEFSNSVAAAGRTSRTWKGSVLKYKRID